MGKPFPAWPNPQAQLFGGSIPVPGPGTRLEPEGAGSEHPWETEQFPTAPEGSAPAQVTAGGFTPLAAPGADFLPLCSLRLCRKLSAAP